MRCLQWDQQSVLLTTTPHGRNCCLAKDLFVVIFCKMLLLTANHLLISTTKMADALVLWLWLYGDLRADVRNQRSDHRQKPNEGVEAAAFAAASVAFSSFRRRGQWTKYLFDTRQQRLSYTHCFKQKGCISAMWYYWLDSDSFANICNEVKG